MADVPVARDPHGLFVSPGALRRHIGVLRRWGYRFVPFSHLARALPVHGGLGLASLTFDDGFVDNLEVLAPLLAEESAPATVFVVSGWMGKKHPEAGWTRVMTALEVAELARCGIEIGAHSVTHPDLTILPPDDVRREMRDSQLALEDATGGPVESFAYPYGRANGATVLAARTAGFEAACRTSGMGSWSDPHDLPRQDMDDAATLIGLWLKKRDWYEPLMRYRIPRAARRATRLAKVARR